MTDSEVSELMKLTARIDERTETILKNQSELFQRTSDLRSQLDKLQQAHNDRTKNGECTIPGNSNGSDKLLNKVLQPKTLLCLSFLAIGGGTPITIIILAINHII